MLNLQTKNNKNQFDELFEDLDNEGYDLTFSISLGAMSLFT